MQIPCQNFGEPPIEALGTFAFECVDANNPQSAMEAIRIYAETIYQMDRGDPNKESLYTELSDRLNKAIRSRARHAKEGVR